VVRVPVEAVSVTAESRKLTTESTETTEIERETEYFTYLPHAKTQSRQAQAATFAFFAALRETRELLRLEKVMRKLCASPLLLLRVLCVLRGKISLCSRLIRRNDLLKSAQICPIRQIRVLSKHGKNSDR